MKNRFAAKLLAALAAASATACTPAGHVSSPTFESGQYTFSTPSQAADALQEAVERQDREQLAKIFGPASADILSSGDDTEDRDALAAFAAAMDKGVEIQQAKNRNPALKNQQLAFLMVGKNQYPFPIALYKQANGWRFDTAVGKQEIIDRRIGKNEIRAIRSAQQYAAAQLAYRDLQRSEGKPAQFARKFFSSPGKRDGLYWEHREGEPLSPLGPLVAAASTEGYTDKDLSSPRPYNGYHFAILTRQGAHARGGAMSYIDGRGAMSRGFALIAYPARYGVSGVTTFLVGPDGIVYQKDLGPKTETIARRVVAFDPDLSWTPVR